jgi:hypothetical protein
VLTHLCAPRIFEPDSAYSHETAHFEPESVHETVQYVNFPEFAELIGTVYCVQFCMFGNIFPTGKMLVSSGKITASDYPCKGVRILSFDGQVPEYPPTPSIRRTGT